MKGLYLTLNFSLESAKFDNEIVKFTAQIAYMQIFITLLTLVCELLDVGVVTNAIFKKKDFSLKY